MGHFGTWSGRNGVPDAWEGRSDDHGSCLFSKGQNLWESGLDQLPGQLYGAVHRGLAQDRDH
jgi:hypothetical protein